MSLDFAGLSKHWVCPQLAKMFRQNQFIYQLNHLGYHLCGLNSIESLLNLQGLTYDLWPLIHWFGRWFFFWIWSFCWGSMWNFEAVLTPSTSPGSPGLLGTKHQSRCAHTAAPGDQRGAAIWGRKCFFLPTKLEYNFKMVRMVRPRNTEWDGTEQLRKLLVHNASSMI